MGRFLVFGDTLTGTPPPLNTIGQQNIGHFRSICFGKLAVAQSAVCMESHAYGRARYQMSGIMNDCEKAPIVFQIPWRPGWSRLLFLKLFQAKDHSAPEKKSQGPPI